MDRHERRQLLDRTREWFAEPEQVAQLRDTVAAGLTPAEALLLHALPPAGRVLDIGCGAGRVTLALAGRGYDVVGVDVSAALLETARSLVRRHGRAPGLLRVDALSLPFGEGTFDAALALKVLCYIPSHHARATYLDEIGRVLRPNAVLLVEGYVVPTEQAAVDQLSLDQQHLRAAEGFRSLEPLDTFTAGRGYVHWYTHEDFVDELAHSSSFELEDVTEDEPGGLLRLAVLRRRR